MHIDTQLFLGKLLIMERKESPTFIDYFTVIIKRRYFIIKTFLIVTVAAIIISLIIPNQYTATATILPPNPQQEAMLGLLSSQVFSFGGLSGLGRILPGATTPSDLFAAILKSDRIMSKIIQKYSLKKVFKTKTMDGTYKQLQSITKFSVTAEGIISVSVTWYDKYLATDIANSFIEELDRFNTETAMTVGKKYRIFIEQRLQANIDTLALAEEALREFQEKHRTIALDTEIESAIKTIAELKSQIILLEVRRGALASSSQFDNPYLHDINKELRELKKQLTKIEFGDKSKEKEERDGFGVGFAVPFSELPEVAIEYARLVRDVEVQSAIYELLVQQYEQAKIMELKDTPTVQFLDRASPPERKSIPKRSQIVLLASFFGLILGIIATFFLESFDQVKKRPEEYKKWVDIFDRLKKDLVYFKTKLLKIFMLRIKH